MNLQEFEAERRALLSTPHLIGLSLSLCIKDVIEGRVSVEQIDSIIANTRIEGPEDLDDVIEVYRHSYWYADPDRAERLTRNLFRLGVISQPRIQNPRHHHTYGYHWHPAPGK